MADKTFYNVKVLRERPGESPVVLRSYVEVGMVVVPSSPNLVMIKNKDGDHVGIIPVATDIFIDCEPVKVKEILKPTIAETFLLPGNDTVH